MEEVCELCVMWPPTYPGLHLPQTFSRLYSQGAKTGSRCHAVVNVMKAKIMPKAVGTWDHRRSWEYKSSQFFHPKKFTKTLYRSLDLHELGHRDGEELNAMSLRSQCRTLVTLAYTNMIRILKVKKNMIRCIVALFPSSHPLIQQLNRKPLLCARSNLHSHNIIYSELYKKSHREIILARDGTDKEQK